jgi:acetyltransferase
VARNRGLEAMEGEVLANNYKMLDLMRSLGFQVQNDPEDPGIKRVWMGL